MSFKICYNMFPKLFNNVMNVQKIFFFYGDGDDDVGGWW